MVWKVINSALFWQYDNIPFTQVLWISTQLLCCINGDEAIVQFLFNFLSPKSCYANIKGSLTMLT